MAKKDDGISWVEETINLRESSRCRNCRHFYRTEETTNYPKCNLLWDTLKTMFTVRPEQVCNSHKPYVKEKN